MGAFHRQLQKVDSLESNAEKLLRDESISSAIQISNSISGGSDV